MKEVITDVDEQTVDTARDRNTSDAYRGLMGDVATTAALREARRLQAERAATAEGSDG